jgi:hypothetical protein
MGSETLQYPNITGIGVEDVEGLDQNPVPNPGSENSAFLATSVFTGLGRLRYE